MYLAGFEFLENAGRGAFFGGLGGEAKAIAAQQRYPRPNLGIAEGERGALDLRLNSPRKQR